MSGVRKGSHPRTYQCWVNMKTRCDNPNCWEGKWYRDLDISYDPRWEFYDLFLEDMGECPDALELDRIDNDKGYFKENCRWATQLQNIRNSSVCKLTPPRVATIKRRLEERPSDYTPMQWDQKVSKEYDVSAAAIYDIRKGRTWSDVKAGELA